MKKWGFTLAEVLITLGIIGVVAALTIPILVQNADEKATITKLKKEYSILSSAYSLAVKENGSPETWDYTSQSAVLGNLAPYLSVTKNCLAGGTGCFPAGVAYKYLVPANGNYGILDNWGYKLRLADGASVFSWYYSACVTSRGTTPALQSICGEYWVDVNGDKNPNQLGQDTFRFYITKYGIVPSGGPAQTNGTFSAGCLTQATADGGGCTAWVIFNENMDYLHCTGLSWSGPTKCN